MTRIATLAEAGRITDTIVESEIARLKRLWQHHAPSDGADGVALDDLMERDAVAALDLFDAMQLKAVIGVCRQSKSMSDAGTRR